MFIINIELYKIFVIVAEEKSLEKASIILHISQQSLTKNIKNLENSLKLKLFKKTSKGLKLTDIGNELYKKLKNPIKEIMLIDNEYSSMKSINIGSHTCIFHKIFDTCIHQFNLEFPKVNLITKSLDTNEMLQMLSNKELDIVFSKKVDSLNLPNLQFIKLGYLNDIFIAKKDSEFYTKLLTIDDLKNTLIYTPNSNSQTVIRLLNLLNIKDLNIKCSTYNNILGLVNSNPSVGIVTKEYLQEDFLKKHNLIEVDTALKLEPIEFGIYLNDNRFKELNNLVQIIKSHFFFKDF